MSTIVYLQSHHDISLYGVSFINTASSFEGKHCYIVGFELKPIAPYFLAHSSHSRCDNNQTFEN